MGNKGAIIHCSILLLDMWCELASGRGWRLNLIASKVCWRQAYEVEANTKGPVDCATSDSIAGPSRAAALLIPETTFLMQNCMSSVNSYVL
jgi:hypothetical protein